MNLKQKIRVLVGINEPYAREKIINCFRHRDEYEVSEYARNGKSYDLNDYDFFWLEYEDLDFEKLTSRLLARPVLFNSYCIRKGLIRKAQLAFYLNKYVLKTPHSNLTKYLPETHIFQLDYLDYMDEALNDVYEVELAFRHNDAIRCDPTSTAKTIKFILKSSMTNKGNDMLLFDSREQLEEFFQRRIDASEDETLDLREWVIQRYIDEPLRLSEYGHRKFHLRVYCLAVGSMSVYVYRDILALFSLDSYEPCRVLDKDQPINMRSHITNTCVQLPEYENDDEYDEKSHRAKLGSKERRELEESCIKRFWSLRLNDNDNENETRKSFIYEQIKDCVGQVFACLACEPAVFQPLPNAFELYGLDFLVDANYNCYFLEANAFPDFKQTGDSLNALVDRLFYQTIAVTSDKYFGELTSPVCDANELDLVYQLQNKKKPHLT